MRALFLSLRALVIEALLTRCPLEIWIRVRALLDGLLKGLTAVT
jgi:hypothetical protein